jgi:PAS domain S-box
MAFGIRKLSLPHKVLFLILVPMIFQVACFSKLLTELNQLESSLDEESQALDTLLESSEIANDLVTASIAALLSRHWKDKSFLAESAVNLINIQNKLSRLKRRNSASKRQLVSLNMFEECLDHMNRAVEQAEMNPKGINDVVFIDEVRKLIFKLTKDKDRMITQYGAIRQETQRRKEQQRDDMRTLLIVVTWGNVIVAGSVAVFFTFTMAGKFQRIMKDIYMFSAGKELLEPLTGNDDLARIDQVVHQLSHELESARKRERSLLDNSAEVICSLDEGLRIMEINPAVERRLGYEQSEVLYANMQSFVHPDDRDSTYAYLEQCKTSGTELTFECRMKRNNGRYIDSEWTTQWGESNFSCVILDISERKEAERLKQEVIAMVSHDLRSPLTSIGLLLEMMLQGAAGELNERGVRLTEHAQQSVGSLIRMINDLLDVERYESGSLSLEYTRILAEDLIATAVQTLTPEAEHKGIKLVSSSDDLKLELDADRINRVLVNLLGNAVKFAPSDSVIEVRCTLLKQDGKPPQAAFSIQDQGPGIPADKLEAVFEKFQQADRGLEGEKKGSGLGLAICRAIVEAHRGEIGVISTEGDGATFWFHVPTEAPNIMGDQTSQSRTDHRIRF